MADYEVYRARADEQRALDLAATTSPFTIVVRFIAGLTQRQQEAFAAAADRWVRVIVGDLPEMLVGDELIDDVLISAQGRPIDGPGHILGSAGPRELRPPEAGAAAFLPATGSMSFDTADLARMEADGRLNDVITHEMGHVLGIGTIWDDNGLLRDAGTDNPVFTGAGAMEEYRVLRGAEDLRPVPVANEGGAGSRDSHWREFVFRNELMSPTIASAGNPMSRMSGGEPRRSRLPDRPGGGRRLCASRPARPRRVGRAHAARFTGRRGHHAAHHPIRAAAREPPDRPTSMMT